MALNHEELTIIDILCGMTGLANQLVEDTAEYLISNLIDIANALEKNDNNKAANKKLNKAIEAFGDQWPEAYRLLLQEKKLFNGDIFFIPEVENPSELQLKAAKIIKSNQMIDALSNAVLIEVTAGKTSRNSSKAT